MIRPERDELAAIIHGIDIMENNGHKLGDDPCCKTAKILASRVIDHFDVQVREPQSPHVCELCHNYVDTPGHIYGCVKLGEAGVLPYAGHIIP